MFLRDVWCCSGGNGGFFLRAKFPLHASFSHFGLAELIKKILSWFGHGSQSTGYVNICKRRNYHGNPEILQLSWNAIHLHSTYIQYPRFPTLCSKKRKQICILNRRWKQKGSYIPMVSMFSYKMWQKTTFISRYQNHFDANLGVMGSVCNSINSL